MESFTVEKERLSKKREEYSKRASKFKELKRKRFEEKKRADEAKQLLSSEDMWEELGRYIVHNIYAIYTITILILILCILHFRYCNPGK